MQKQLNKQVMGQYISYMMEEEFSKNTIDKYTRDIKKFLNYIAGKELSKMVVLEYKNELKNSYAVSSVNSMLASVNGFLEWSGYIAYKVKPIKMQREIYADSEKELSEKEYLKLIRVASEKGNRKLVLMMQTMCSVGIRVSELQYITMEAIAVGKAEVLCKRKQRIVLLSKELCKMLQRYCKENGIKTGYVFRTKSGGPMDRSNIWKMMKMLCKEAGVEKSKVFPHNLRHLFARTFYKVEKDIGRLADILGHTNVNTTRIYTMETGDYHRRQIEKMKSLLAL